MSLPLGLAILDPGLATIERTQTLNSFTRCYTESDSWDHIHTHTQCENPCDGKQDSNILICSVVQGQHVTERCVPVLIEFFVNNTNLTFLTFLYKISNEVFQKNKVASSGTRTHNTDYRWFYKSDGYQPICVICENLG